MRLFAIGDIHGCSTALRRLDRELAFRSSDIVVTLGDYIDRGPDSQGVIDFLLELGQRCQLITLRGNHELMALRAAPVHLQEWMANGGDATLHSYGVKTPAGIPAAHWAFLESTVAYHETGTSLSMPMPTPTCRSRGSTRLHALLGVFGRPLRPTCFWTPHGLRPHRSRNRASRWIWDMLSASIPTPMEAGG